VRARLGLWIAIAALGVNAPRLVQAFLEADGLQLNATLRPILMGATGVAAALTLTGGGAWLAHELAASVGERLQGVLLTCWLLVLGGQLVLIPPLLMVEMGSSRLGTVLPENWQRWSWAFVAVLLVELVAAGAMVAQGRRSRWAEERRRDEEHMEKLALERAELERQLDARATELAALRQFIEAADDAADDAADGAAEMRVSRRKKRRSASRKRSGSAQRIRTPCRNRCGWVGRSQPAENAHQRVCDLKGNA
jgi:hypothetical protein